MIDSFTTVAPQDAAHTIIVAEPSKIVLNLTREHIASIIREGNDLIIVLDTKETIRLVGFYTDVDKPSELYLVDENDRAILVKLRPLSANGEVAAEYLPLDEVAGFVSDSDTNLLHWGLGVLGVGGLAGGIAAAVGGSGGHKSNNGDDRDNTDNVDRTAPVVTLDGLTTGDATPALSGTVDDPTATIVVTVGGVDYAATNHGDGTWSLADDTLPRCPRAKPPSPSPPPIRPATPAPIPGPSPSTPPRRPCSAPRPMPTAPPWC